MAEQISEELAGADFINCFFVLVYENKV